MDGGDGVVGVEQRRFAWGLVDQGLSSATNFGGSVLAARVLTASEFGAVAIGFAVYLLAMGVSRSWSSEPLLIRFSAEGAESQRRAISAAAGAALGVGVMSGVVAVAAGLVLRGETGRVLLVLALLLPGLLLQDLWRFALIMVGRSRSAALNDLVWLAAVLIAFAAVMDPDAGAPLALACWGAGASAGALLGLAQLGCLPKARVASWWRAHRDLAVRYSVEFLLVTGASYGLVMGVALLGGMKEAAGFRGAQVVLGPLNVLFMGVSVQALPILARWRAADPARLVRGSRWMASTLAAGALGWGIGASLLPDAWGVELLGDTWPEAAPLVPFLALAYVASGAAAGAITGLRALADAPASLRVRAHTAPLGVLLGVAGALSGGAHGAVVGLALASGLALPLWWKALGRSARDPDARSRRVDLSAQFAGDTVP